MKRLSGLLLIVSGMIAVAVFATPAFAGAKTCSENAYICTEASDSVGNAGEYTGHDEPSILFYSNRAGAGNSNVYRFVLPKDPFQHEGIVLAVQRLTQKLLLAGPNNEPAVLGVINNAGELFLGSDQSALQVGFGGRRAAIE